MARSLAPALSSAALLAGFGFTLSACDQLDKIGLTTPRDVAQCETFIRSGLRSPSTYHRLSITVADGKRIGSKEFRRMAGLGKPVSDLEKLDAELDDVNHLSLREMGIEYEAANAYGAPIKGVGICAFRLIDGELESKEQIEMHRRNAETASQLAELEAIGLVNRKAVRKVFSAPAHPKYGCCL